MIKRILVAYDGTDMAKRALELALDMADRYSARLKIMSVVPDINKSEKILLEAIEKAQELYPKLTIIAKIIEGDPADMIVDVAKNEEFDLIVMGSKGMSDIQQLLVGSVSDSVTTNSEVPVLVVKQFLFFPLMQIYHFLR